MKLTQVLTITIAVVLVGCSGLTRGAVQVRQIAPIDSEDRVLVVLSQTQYVGDLSAELGPYGFRIRPLVRSDRGGVAVTRGGDGLAFFEETRYGIQIEQRFDQNCAFTPNSIYHFTVTVVDIHDNEVVLVVRQTGADGACTTVGAVWPTIARAIADHWGEMDPR